MRLIGSLLLLLAIGVVAAGCSLQRYSSFTTPRPLEADHVLVIGFLGGRDAWDEQRVGVGRLAAKLAAEQLPGVHVVAVENMKRGLALRLVRESFDRDGDSKLSPEEKAATRIILYGQSFGGAGVVKFARQLHKLGIPVQLTVQVDSVGVNDALIPPNVRAAANLFQRNGIFVRGEQRIRAADPERTTILANRRYDYRDRKISLTHLPRHKRIFRNDHMRMDSDPEVWSEVERLVRDAIAQTIPGEKAAGVLR
jgi:hypothetical protein